ncbi:MAG: Lrp/AsnC family transcriptional regulator [Actinomycetota bacterium]|nr:Lrp/AsnC family transcriptional regulator [Actinomycetota bacterium]
MVRPRPARPRPAVADRAVPAQLLDDVGKAILRQLQEDGRRSYTAIGDAVGLSEAAVRHRVRALIDSGVLQIVAVADPITLGFGVMATVGVSVVGDSRRAAETISQIPEVDYCVLTSGRYDLQLEIVCRDNEHLLSVINDRIRTVEGVRETETSICLRVHKQTYNYGTPD